MHQDGYVTVPRGMNLTKQDKKISIQCPPLNRITLGQHKSDNNNRMIQLTDVFCVLLKYNGAINI